MNYQEGKLKKKKERKIPLIIASKKLLGNNSTKEVKDLYSEYCKTLKKEIEEDTNKWKHIYIPCSQIGRLKHN